MFAVHDFHRIGDLFHIHYKIETLTQRTVSDTQVCVSFKVEHRNRTMFAGHTCHLIGELFRVLLYYQNKEEEERTWTQRTGAKSVVFEKFHLQHAVLFQRSFMCSILL